MADQPVTIFHLEIPLRRPFATATGIVGSRSVALVRLGSDPPFGWGEAAPYPGQDESIAQMLQAAKAGDRTPTLSAALDEATADREARIKGVPLRDTIGATMSEVPISLAVGLADDPVGVIEKAVGEGVNRFKLKIAPGRLEHIRAVRGLFPEVVVGVDANGSFDADTVGELAALGDLEIAYLEQPVDDLRSDAALRAREITGVPLFADESVRSVAGATRVLALDPVDGLVVKPGRLGWVGALAVRELANASGKLWRASGLLETGIGRAYTDTLAACPDAFVSDVAPAEWFLRADITESRHDGGHITVPSAPGLGVAPSPDLLDRYLVGRFDLG